MKDAGWCARFPASMRAGMQCCSRRVACDAAYRSGNNARDPRPFFYSLVGASELRPFLHLRGD